MYSNNNKKHKIKKKSELGFTHLRVFLRFLFNLTKPLRHLWWFQIEKNLWSPWRFNDYNFSTQHKLLC